VSPAQLGLLPGAQAPAPPATPQPLEVLFHVVGTPKGMGSKSAFVVRTKGGGVRAVVTDAVDKGDAGQAKVAWQDAVTAAALMAAPSTPLQGAVRVELVFRLRRPTGQLYPPGHKREGQVRGNAPAWPAGKPDVDKLVRATLDAVKVAGVYQDDARVVHLQARKEYAEPGGAPPGCTCWVVPL
jgi:Holliday junction resolvase RusA-like endonuclease